MANLKRPAEKNIITKSKKARISNEQDKTYSPTKNQRHDIEDSPAESTDHNSQPGESFSGMINKLQAFQGEASRREKWATGFKDRAAERRAAVLTKIENAKDQIVKNENDYQDNMLLILTSLTQGLALKEGTSVRVPKPLKLEAIEKTTAMKQAVEVVGDCEALLDCYQNLCEASTIMLPESKTREVLVKDQQETTRVFEASRKSTINQLQARFVNNLGEDRIQFTLDEHEKLLAKRVMGRGKQQEQGEMGEEGIGALLYGFGKVVGKMQGLAE